jgi:hypothetical protein
MLPFLIWLFCNDVVRCSNYLGQPYHTYNGPFPRLNLQRVDPRAGKSQRIYLKKVHRRHGRYFDDSILNGAKIVKQTRTNTQFSFFYLSFLILCSKLRSKPTLFCFSFWISIPNVAKLIIYFWRFVTVLLLPPLLYLPGARSSSDFHAQVHTAKG